VSSLAAAGPADEGDVRREPDRPTPISDYGRSKREGEIELQKWAPHLPITIVRPGIVYGARDEAMAEIARPIHRTCVHTIVGHHTPPLSFVFVEDLIRLILDAAQCGETLSPHVGDGYSGQGIYFACDDSEYPDYAELGRRIGRLLGRHVLVWPLPPLVGLGVSSVVEAANRLRGRSSFLNADKIREGMAHSWACSAQKAREQLAFAPEKPLDARLKETLDWYLRERWI